MSKKPAGRSLIIFYVIYSNVKLEPPLLGFFLVFLEVFGPNPSIDLDFLSLGVPNTHLVHFVCLNVIDHYCTSR